MSLNIFSGMTAFIVAGLIGATITFLLMHLGVPRDWFSIGYDVGKGIKKKPKKIPVEFLDAFYSGKDIGSRVRPIGWWKKDIAEGKIYE